MHFKFQNFFSLLNPYTSIVETSTLFNHHQWRYITKVSLKWVKNKFIDHLIDKETDLKAAMLLKDAIKRSPTSFITAKTVQDWQKHLGLTIPVVRFLRRTVSLQSIYPLKWDMGFPDFFEKSIVSKYPDHISLVKDVNGLPSLRLVQWRDEFAISNLQKSCESSDLGSNYWDFKKGKNCLAFPMNFPKGYGYQKKVRVWMEEFQKLLYISPYDDSSKLDPKSELMEKRIVGLLHEFLSLTVHKKTKRNYLRSLREELDLPHRFTRIFTRYPGIFYLPLKCKTTTVTLKEGYKKGRLIDPHPLARLRGMFYHVMRTGLLYQGKGLNHLSTQD